MNSPDANTSVRELLDREQLRELIHRVGRCLDTHDFHGLRQLYTQDAVARTPGGHAEGIDALITQAKRSHTRTPAVQHLITDIVFDLMDDEATIEANLLATFVDGGTPPSPTFQLGECYRFTARRQGEGWRLTSVTSTPVWVVGERP